MFRIIKLELWGYQVVTSFTLRLAVSTDITYMHTVKSQSAFVDKTLHQVHIHEIGLPTIATCELALLRLKKTFVRAQYRAVSRSSSRMSLITEATGRDAETVTE